MRNISSCKITKQKDGGMTLLANEVYLRPFAFDLTKVSVKVSKMAVLLVNTEQWMSKNQEEVWARDPCVWSVTFIPLMTCLAQGYT